MGSDGHKEGIGIEGVDLGCGLRMVGWGTVRVGMKYIKTKPLHCSEPLLVILGGSTIVLLPKVL